MKARVVLEFRVCQEQGLLALLVRQEGLPGVVLPIWDVLRQVLILALRQQQDADDADECTAGKDDVVQEVAFLVVQLHDGGGQAAKTRTGQDQPQPSAPVNTAEVRAQPHTSVLEKHFNDPWPQAVLLGKQLGHRTLKSLRQGCLLTAFVLCKNKTK